MVSARSTQCLLQMQGTLAPHLPDSHVEGLEGPGILTAQAPPGGPEAGGPGLNVKKRSLLVLSNDSLASQVPCCSEPLVSRQVPLGSGVGMRGSMPWMSEYLAPPFPPVCGRRCCCPSLSGTPPPPPAPSWMDLGHLTASSSRACLCLPAGFIWCPGCPQPVLQAPEAPGREFEKRP